MRNHIVVAYLGLTDREVKVIRSMFRLVPQLKGHELVDPQQAHKSDVVLVNTDYALAVRWWNGIAKHNPLAVPLMLNRNGAGDEPHTYIRRPIQIKAFVDALRKITSTRVAEPDAESDEGPALKVLVVDDSYPVRKYMQHKLPELCQEKITISFAASGEDAMQQIWEDSFDIVFLDVVMKGMDGYKVCKAIKAERFAYVVMLTGKKSPFDKIRGTMSGCDAYITKPPSDDRLKEELRKCIDQRDEALSQLTIAADAP